MIAHWAGEGEDQTVGRRAVDGEGADAPAQLYGTNPELSGLCGRGVVGEAAAVLRGRGDPDLGSRIGEGLGEGDQTQIVDAVVIGDQNSRRHAGPAGFTAGVGGGGPEGEDQDRDPRRRREGFPPRDAGSG
ncbi:hypothetical protein D3C72_943600 [compost metagenome]